MPLVGGTDEPGLPDNNSNNNKVPLWAVLMSLVYLCKRKLTSVVKPTRQWGPGDPQVTFGDQWVGDWKEGWVVINESLEMDSNCFTIMILAVWYCLCLCLISMKHQVISML